LKSMCGIAICLTHQPVRGNPFTKTAMDLLAHRGPDGHGFWNDDTCWMLHRRLAIQDLSVAGQQPMQSPSGRYQMVFNGEIYNHLNLRKRFLCDVSFRGHSDTETLLALFERLGSGMLPHLVGMWAFVIWDVQEQQAFISRDRFGQKPLYWCKRDGDWFFSSELKPLLAGQGAQVYNPLAISEYLALGNYDHLGTETFYQHIFSFPPASFAFLKHGDTGLAAQSYWRLDEVPHRDRVPFQRNEAARLRELVIQSVESQLLSDVPVGATLSGGLDSSIIASCLAVLGKKGFPVFTAQFPGSAFDESPYVEALRERFEGSFEVIRAPVGSIRLQKDMGRVIHQQEEPFGDPSIMAHGFLVQAAQQHGIPVLLGGQGGDELSMGYPWMVQRLAAYSLNKGRVTLFADVLKSRYVKLPVAARILLGGFFPAVEKKFRLIMRKRQKSWLRTPLQIPSPAVSFGTSTGFDEIYRESLYSVGLPHLCHYDDRSTMARSIEGRMPFLDHRLFEFVSRLREDAFYRNGLSKYLLREAFHAELPDCIRTRKDKIGFFTPLRELVLQDADWIAAQLVESRLLKDVLADDFLQTVLAKLKTSRGAEGSDYRVIFRLLSLAIWHNQFNRQP